MEFPGAFSRERNRPWAGTTFSPIPSSRGKTLLPPYYYHLSPMIDPTWMKLVEDKNLSLNEAIKDLEHRQERSLELSLSTQKQELSIAHSDKIQQLKDEIDSIKLDKIALEEKIASDERVVTLENERDYYRKESIQLNATVEMMTSKLDKCLLVNNKMKSEINRLKLGSSSFNH